MDAHIRDYFVHEVRRLFAFLVEAHGFQGPEVIVDEEIHFTFVIYQRSNVAIELIWDEREEHVDCKIARVIGGRKTTHYERDDDGELVRYDLFNLLQARGVGDPLLRWVRGLTLVDKITSKLEDFAAMLRKHGGDILRDSPTVFQGVTERFPKPQK